MGQGGGAETERHRDIFWVCVSNKVTFRDMQISGKKQRTVNITKRERRSYLSQGIQCHPTTLKRLTDRFIDSNL